MLHSHGASANRFSVAMKDHTTKPDEPPVERPDEWWYRIYFAVIVTTVAVIALLEAFSYYFSH